MAHLFDGQRRVHDGTRAKVGCRAFESVRGAFHAACVAAPGGFAQLGQRPRIIFKKKLCDFVQQFAIAPDARQRRLAIEHGLR